MAVGGDTTAALIETYVERVLGPTLREGQVVVMDNLSAHKGVSISAMSRAIRQKLDWSYKKRRWVPPSATNKREVLSGSL
jgi:transposase